MPSLIHFLRSALLFLLLLVLAFPHAGAAPPSKFPADYPLDYPAVATFCLPVRTYVADVMQPVQELNGQLYRHMPNGGYGLPIEIQVDGKHLLHLGVDVAWSRAGDPVFAIADGVVRTSTGPDDKPAQQNSAAKKLRQAADKLQWGNLVVIEHRLWDGSFITSVYGHLSSKRLVQAGDRVKAGMPIGSIGRRGKQNGGFDPHLHLGIRDGRFAEIGKPVFQIHSNQGWFTVVLTGIDKTEIEIEAKGVPDGVFQMPAAGENFVLRFEQGRTKLPARFLYHCARPDFAIVGYAVTADGWRDPTEFLRKMNAVDPPLGR